MTGGCICKNRRAQSSVSAWGFSLSVQESCRDNRWRATYTFALNDPSTCTSAIFVVPRNCKVGLPRILSSANASGFSNRSNLDFPLGVDVTAELPRSPDADGAESRVRVKLRPSRTMYESGSSSAPRYSRRWLATIDVDAFDVSVSIVETRE